MAQSTDRLRRRLADELGGCRDEDVERRLEELWSIAAATFESDEIRPPFEVLGNTTRYRLARALSTAEEELCVCELDPLVDVSESAISHALSDLIEAGLVTRRKEGNWRYYRSTELADALFETADRLIGHDE